MMGNNPIFGTLQLHPYEGIQTNLSRGVNHIAVPVAQPHVGDSTLQVLEKRDIVLLNVRDIDHVAHEGLI